MKHRAGPLVWVTFTLLCLALISLFQNCGSRGRFHAKQGIDLSSLSEPKEPPGHHLINFGEFRTTAAGERLNLKIDGRAMMVRNSKGTTEVHLQVMGLDPSITYKTDIHSLPCALDGGNHYKFDQDINEAKSDNEISLSLAANDSGIAIGSTKEQHYARPDAQSVVVHAVDGTRIACADLLTDSYSMAQGGAFMPLTDANTGLTGVAVLTRSTPDRTTLKMSVGGLSPDTSYGARLHVLPCGAGGGVQYRIDPLIIDEITENEVQTTLSTDPHGSALATVTLENHIVRSDAQSILIHADNDKTDIIACSDLRESADFLTLPKGYEMGMNITGTAQMNRLDIGQTRFRLKMRGLEALRSYNAVLGNLPCGSNSDSPYRPNIQASDDMPDNDIRLSLDSDAAGLAEFDMTVEHLTRADARAVLVKDADTGSALACADL